MEYLAHNISTNKYLGAHKGLTLDLAAKALLRTMPEGRLEVVKYADAGKEATLRYESKDGSRLHKLLIFEAPF